MPVVIRDSGKMWNRLGELEDVKCLIPDRSYAQFYQEVISYIKSVGQFDVATMGNVVRTPPVVRVHPLSRTWVCCYHYSTHSLVLYLVLLSVGERWLDGEKGGRVWLA
jgi:Monomeric isocitrate dehydrogenase